jgi:hypothetical protein
MWEADTWEGMEGGGGGGTLLVDEYLIQLVDDSPDIFFDSAEFVIELEDSSFDIEIDTE